MSSENLDRRIMVDVGGSRRMKREQWKYYASEESKKKSASWLDKQIRELDLDQRRVYDAIIRGQEDLEVVTGLGKEEINKAIDSLVSKGLLKRSNEEDLAQQALDDYYKTGSEASRVKAGLSLYGVGRKDVAGALIGKGDIETLGEVSYKDLLKARGVRRLYGEESSGWFPKDDWRNVSELRKGWGSWSAENLGKFESDISADEYKDVGESVKGTWRQDFQKKMLSTWESDVLPNWKGY